MSFCPTKDLHSVYLDNEMPEIYKAEYEEHVKNCPTCQKQLNDLKILHGLLQSDSKAITPDSHYLDQSYERLLIKMKYNKNTSKNSFEKSKSFMSAVSAIAAAAVFAVVVPVGLRSGVFSKSANSNTSRKTGGEVPTSVASNLTSATSNSALGLSGVSASGNFGAVAPVGTSVMTNAYNTSYSNSQYPNKHYNNQYNSGRSVVISGNIDESVLTSVNTESSSSINREVSSVGNKKSTATMIREVEVFRPAFNEVPTITIKVTVPGMNAVPVTTEYEVPVPVIFGR